MAQGDTKVLRRESVLARAKTQAACVDLRFVSKKFDYYFVNSRNYITADYSMNPSLKLIQRAGLKKLNELASSASATKNNNTQNTFIVDLLPALTRARQANFLSQAHL